MISSVAVSPVVKYTLRLLPGVCNSVKGLVLSIPSPAAIDVRRQFFPEPDRVTYIAQSLLDPSWCKDINTENGVFMIAEAVFQFFDEAQMKQFFLTLADNFPGGEIVFTTMSRSDGFRGWADMFPQEQRDAMKAAWMNAMKEWWETVPKDQKDKAIAALKTPTNLRVRNGPISKTGGTISAMRKMGRQCVSLCRPFLPYQVMRLAGGRQKMRTKSQRGITASLS